MTSLQAQLDIQSPKADLSIEQPKAELQIERTPSQISIDQTQAWNNLNLKSAFVRISDAADAGRQAVLEGIARRASEGDELMQIENKGSNPIANQAAQDSEVQISYDTGSVPPFEAVKISGRPGQLNINWQTHQPVIQTTSHSPEMTFHPGQLNIYMDQYPSLSIDVVGGQVDTRV